jgi:hypothetical protein
VAALFVRLPAAAAYSGGMHADPNGEFYSISIYVAKGFVITNKCWPERMAMNEFRTKATNKRCETTYEIC